MYNSIMNKSKIAIYLTVIWVILNFVVVCYADKSNMDLSNWGEFLGGSAGILALIWLIMGYFQQSEELRLNTDVLKTQQKELEKQVEATHLLAEHTAREATATENMADMNVEEKRERRQKEEKAAEPIFYSRGGSGGDQADRLETRILNKGGNAFDVKIIDWEKSENGRSLGLNATEFLKNTTDARLTIIQRQDQGKFPFNFRIECRDELNRNLEIIIEYSGAHEIKQLSINEVKE